MRWRIALDGPQVLTPLGESAVALGVVVCLAVGRILAPRENRVGSAGARRILEFRRRRETVDSAFLRRAPFQVRRGIVAVDEDDRHVLHARRNAPAFPMQRRLVFGRIDEQLVLGVGDRRVGYLKIVDADARASGHDAAADGDKLLGQNGRQKKDQQRQNSECHR